MNQVVTISRAFHFYAARRLTSPLASASCRSLHGATFLVKVTVSGILDKVGMVLDFGRLDKIVTPLLPDHTCLVSRHDTELWDAVRRLEHSRICLMDDETTTENIAAMLGRQLAEAVKAEAIPNIIEIRVAICERENTNCAEVVAWQVADSDMVVGH